jgi:hypothetical protein
VPTGTGTDTDGPVVETVAPTLANAILGPTSGALDALGESDHVTVASRTRTGCWVYVYEMSALTESSKHTTVSPVTTGALAPLQTSTVPAEALRITRYPTSAVPDMETRGQLRATRVADWVAETTGATLGMNVAPVND